MGWDMDIEAKSGSSGATFSASRGGSHAPKIFSAMPEGKGIKKREFAAAMERLIHLGKIKLDTELWRDAHRKAKRGIRATEASS